jgi:DNA-directed RNA polymerase specialized sigma24 family protein
MLYRVVAADAFSTERQHLWDLCYRATGSAADADMLLRDCFARAMERPLVDQDADWRSHLTRAAAVLAMDALRHRKRRNYVGCWLPSPVETGTGVSRGPRPSTSSHGPRYDIVESGSIAFLMALEALEPRERLTFLMCDAFGVEPHDAAATLELPSGTAKSALQQARRKMQTYDSTHVAPTAGVQTHTADVLRHCLSCLQNHDAAPLEKMLAPDARAHFDSAGEFVAPLAPVSGPARIARLQLKFADGAEPMRFAFRMLNGLPAALGVSPGRPRWARRFVFRIETRGDLVSELQTITASAKLTAVRFDPD